MRNLIFALSLLLLFAFSADAQVVELKKRELKPSQNSQANGQNLYSQHQGQVKATDGTRRKAIQPNLQPTLLFPIFPIDRIFAFFIEITNGPPGVTVTFEVFQTNPSILGFANLVVGPYLERIFVQVKIDEVTRIGISDDFFVKGLKPGDTIFTGCSTLLGCVINPQPVTVASVIAVEFESLTGPRAAELSDNPTDLGGGKRIFPDADSPTGVTKSNHMKLEHYATAFRTGLMERSCIALVTSGS